MKNKMQLFENAEFGKLEVVMIDDKPYFPATECAKTIGHTNPERAIREFCKGVTETVTPSAGGNQKKKYIPEGDLYRLIVRSKVPAAERFETWVFDEVLPAIRKQGMYISESALRKIFRSTAPLPQLSDYNNAARYIISALRAADVLPDKIAENIVEIYAPLGISVSLDGIGMSDKVIFTASDIARANGMYSASGKLHCRAAGAIISMLGIGDEHRIIRPHQFGSSVNFFVNYDKYAMDAVSAWLDENHSPQEIPFGAKVYKVTYKYRDFEKERGAYNEQ